MSAAVELLDAEGVEALSMRRLGTALGAGAASLYRHVAGKDELIELVVDRFYGELAVPDPADGAHWRDAITACARDLRAAALRHPWVVAVHGQAGLSQLGPNLARFSEGVLAVFEAAGFDLEEADRAMSVVLPFVIGMVSSEAAWLSVVRRGGMDEKAAADRLWAVTQEAMRDHPRLLAVYAGQRGTDSGRVVDAYFDYGLDRLLDGLAARLPADPAQSTGPAEPAEPAERAEPARPGGCAD
ncbi:TetR/AcrR family transcriptional regulator [Streptomonospora mangrovi]|uniref:TetR/AcrR family transcriptional regulator n=1 Tax=Streptomonospora mangrovi TaxID=2883123 RepID=UPI0022DE4B05|nr:TetR/AcrR family transcriptional regulator [Streptomonospora mangrovi]